MNKDYLEYIEKVIKNKINDNKIDTEPILYKGMEYSLLGGGKRIRPYLMLLSAEFLEINFKDIEDLFFSLECIHTYSLVHDDLPCMDNDDLRRGRPTSHKVYGEGMAVLIGDALLNLAYENLFSLILKDSKYAKSAKLIAESAGYKGMIDGQVIDITKTEYSEEEILKMYYKKTGRLIYCALMSPYFLTDGDVNEKDLTVIAENLGLIFQLTDDILDYDEGVDKDKITYITLFGKEKGKNLIKKLQEDTLIILDKYADRGKNLAELTNFIVERKK